MAPPIPNVVTISYDYYLGCYLAGIFAARMSKTGKLGFIGGVSIPPSTPITMHSKLGRCRLDPMQRRPWRLPVRFKTLHAGKKSPRKCIQTDAAATDFGIIAAANEVEGRLVSVLDPSEFPMGPKSVISIVGLDFGVSLYNEVTLALKKDWKGGRHEHTGLGTGVVDFILSPLFAQQGPKDIVDRIRAVEPEVARARAAILDGSLKVAFNTQL